MIIYRVMSTAWTAAADGVRTLMAQLQVPTAGDPVSSGPGSYLRTALQSLANRIAPAKPQPGPGDSQKTDWQSGWDENDEAAYQNLMGVWDGGSWNQMLSLETEQRVTQRTLLRLIESCPRKDVRGELWARYNMRREAS